MGDKRGSGPRVGVASQLGQGDTDTFLSGGLLYRIRAVITPLKITLDETRGGGGVVWTHVPRCLSVTSSGTSQLKDQEGLP